jgi:amidase
MMGSQAAPDPGSPSGASRALQPSEIDAASALEQARWIEARRVSVTELTTFYLDRIRAHDGRLHAFVDVLARAALKDARAKDRSRDRVGPFFGVPIGIKDLNFVRGSFTRFGTRALKWLWTPFDDAMTAQIRRGGFVILGKLTTSELGAMPVTEPPTHPPTRNPWDLARTAGGSSGGSAAAVAAGLLPIAQGSDGAGSIRIPSALCHLFGFKASRGVVPDPYRRSDPRNLSVSGPIARTVDDAAAMLDVMAGVSPRIDGHAPRSSQSYAEAARRRPPRLRIRVALASPLATPDPEIRARVEKTARVLEELGHHVEEGPIADGTLQEFLPLWQRVIASVPVPSGALGPVPQWLARAGKTLSKRDVEARHDMLSRRILDWFGDADLWLTPTVARVPPRVGELDRGSPDKTFEAAAVLGAFTAPFNITGQPAASIPAGLTSGGLPIGVQLAGRPDQDATVLAVCRELEEAMPWRHLSAPFPAVPAGTKDTR